MTLAIDALPCVLMTPLDAIRPLTSNDALAWAVLRKEALEQHPLAFGSSAPDNPDVLVRQFGERIAFPAEGAIFGAFTNSTLVGIVGVKRNEGTKECHKALLWGMFVTPGSRGHGVGALLLEQAISWARAWKRGGPASPLLYGRGGRSPTALRHFRLLRVGTRTTGFTVGRPLRR